MARQRQDSEETLTNISDWPMDKVEALRDLLRAEGDVQVVPRGEAPLEITRSLPAGHVAAVLGCIKRLDLPAKLGLEGPGAQRVLALIAARILDPDPSCRPLKARAWLDLTNRRAAGEAIDSADTRKHRNDCLRLVALIPGDRTVKWPHSVRSDLEGFIDAVGTATIEPKSLGLGNVQLADLAAAMRQLYLG